MLAKYTRQLLLKCQNSAAAAAVVAAAVGDYNAAGSCRIGWKLV
jgi:hypothetical protein